MSNLTANKGKLLDSEGSILSSHSSILSDSQGTIINDFAADDGFSFETNVVVVPPEEGDPIDSGEVIQPIDPTPPIEVVIPNPPEQNTPAVFRIIERDNRMEGDAEDSGVHNVSLVDVDNVLEHFEYKFMNPADGSKYHEVPVTFRVYDPDVTGSTYEEMLEFNFNRIGYQQDIEIVGLSGYNLQPGDIGAITTAVYKAGIDPLNPSQRTYENTDHTQKDLNLLFKDDLLRAISEQDGEVIIRIKFMASDTYDQQTVSQEFSIIFNGNKQSVVNEVNSRQDVDDITIDDVDIHKAHPDYGSNGNWPESNSGGSIGVIVEEGSDGGTGNVDLDEGEHEDIIFPSDGDSSTDVNSAEGSSYDFRDNIERVIDIISEASDRVADNISELIGNADDIIDMIEERQGEIIDRLEDLLADADVFSFDDSSNSLLSSYDDYSCVCDIKPGNNLEAISNAELYSLVEDKLSQYLDVDLADMI